MVKLSIKGSGYHNVKIWIDDEEITSKYPITEFEILSIADEQFKMKLTLLVKDLDIELDNVALEKSKKEVKT